MTEGGNPLYLLNVMPTKSSNDLWDNEKINLVCVHCMSSFQNFYTSPKHIDSCPYWAPKKEQDRRMTKSGNVLVTSLPGKDVMVPVQDAIDESSTTPPAKAKKQPSKSGKKSAKKKVPKSTKKKLAVPEPRVMDLTIEI